jgi:hypothetical protein
MIEPKWASGDFIPQQLADVLVEENIEGQVKASICRNKSSEICQESPICARALWNWGDFCNILIGLTFPINCVRQSRPPFKMADVTKNRHFFNCPLLL